MSKISSMMDVGRRSMMNSQTALQTVGHNIANKSTEGYSRQRVELQSTPPAGLGNLRIGTGARTSAVTRTNNEYLERQIAGEQSELGYAKDRAEALARVEQVFNEQINKGLNHYIGEFFNSMRELSNSPESLAARTLVKESADNMSKDFNRVHKQLTAIQSEFDFQLRSHLEEINAYSKEIADLNERVQQVEVGGASANDERDRRDLLLKKLGEKIDIRYSEGDNGVVTVSAGSAVLLVAGNDAKRLELASTPESDGKREGQADIVYKNSPDASGTVVTHHFHGGAVGALVEVRDQVINDVLSNIDELAHSIAYEVNKAHVEGFDKYSKKGGLFFEVPDHPRDASQSIRVADRIAEDVGRIAASSAPNAPSNNTIAHIISNIQNRGVVGTGASRVGEFYEGLVGRLGVVAQRANSTLEAQQDILNQLKNIRESVSGVSLDEETSKMIEYQKSFDASARLIRTADELLDTVLNLKRY